MPSTYQARLMTLRQSQGLSRQELAGQAGIEVTSLWRHEYGKILDPSLDTVIALAEVLGVSIDYLLGRVDTFDLHLHDMGFGEIYRAYTAARQPVRRAMAAAVREVDRG